LRGQLGIRFPVYLLLSKADVLHGFNAYFSTLTSEARAQVWGFTLPWQESSSALSKLRKSKANGALHKSGTGQANTDQALTLAGQVVREFEALVDRIGEGVASRLQEEFELEQRQSLYLLPHELKALEAPLQELVEAVFADSRYDTTQIQPMLRGVYLTSAMQTGQEISAQPHALWVRLQKAFALAGRAIRLAPAPTGGLSRRSYFLTDLMQRVVFAEAHLVKPNLRWEARTRLLRWIGHSVVLLTFFWLSGALTLSFHNNKGYLEQASEKTELLTAEMKRWLTDRSVQQTDKVLNLAQALPLQSGLDLSAPAMSYQYGLYSPHAIATASQEGYNQLLDRLVLPEVIAHMAQVMKQAVTEDDAPSAYETLRVYLLLHDGKKFAESPDNARDVRQWVTQEWQNSPDAPTESTPEGAAADTNKAAKTTLSLPQRLGNSTSMVGHLEWLFSGQRAVQSGTSANEALVGQVRAFLDKRTSSERLYERAISALLDQSPQDFSLIRALGPQAGTVFSRASGASLEQGVPGLFTYDGYHDVFAKQLPKILVLAQQDDNWVMGKAKPVVLDQKKSAVDNKSEQQALVEDVRRQYLSEYAELWEEFLNDVRLIKSDKSGTLAFDLGVLRQLASADSPLVRLGRLSARETTLSRPLLVNSEDKSIFDKAADQLAQQQSKAATGLGVRPEQRTERQWVDDKFSALREVVAGQAQGTPGPPGAKLGLEGMTSALNEYYTVLVVADSALSSGSLPPAGTESATKLRIEAGKLPAPLREVLLDVSKNGAEKVAQGAAVILRSQAQLQMDRLVGLLALTVSEPCQRLIAGRYPFADSPQEVGVDDFNAFFASGGAADEYFKKHLLPLVDTSVRPWRYKTEASAQLMTGTEGMAQGQAPTGVSTGPTLLGELLKLLAQTGPNPDAFAQVGQIREMFFREQEGKRLGWRGEYKVVSLDAGVTEWVIDLDGQVQRYAHGPIQTIPLQWPGPRGGTMAELHAHPRIKADTSSIGVRGPWAWLRLMERGKLVPSTQPGKLLVEFGFDNRRAVMEVSSAGASPFNSPVLRNFTCPGRST
jgi:type VI secretion system protein ImpL